MNIRVGAVPVLSLLAAVLAVGASGCQVGGQAVPSAQAHQPKSSSLSQQHVAATLPAGGADLVWARMSEAQRVGQLFMTGGSATGVTSETLDQITTRHIGSVMLTGRSSAGTAATAAISAGIQTRATAAATLSVPELIATDQEGGYVQVLSGPGFSTIPTGLTQGSYATSTLRSLAQTWGGQLHSAGVNLDLAPVMDTVPSAAFAPYNPPIGYYEREYGFTPATVAAHGQAFVQGMTAAHVGTAVKHFPGLGRVTANTDTSSVVVDSTTTRYDSYVGAFGAGVGTPTQVVMMSSATYSKIDPANAAVFSPTVINGILRGDLGFTGVVMTDDINGRAISGIPSATRAQRFIDAGGDLILSVNPVTIPPMYDSVLARTGTDAGFRSRVDAAVRRVLLAKQRMGLVRGAAAGDFTGDGRADQSVWRPSTGTWYVHGQASVRYGQSGDVPVPGDYDGVAHDQLAVWRPSSGIWYVYGHQIITIGQSGDIPVAGDYTGDGRTDAAVWRPSNGTWYVNGQSPVAFGQSGDVPVPGDYNGDGRTDLAVWRPSNGTWYVRGYAAVPFGQSGDVLIPADYDGDGVANIALLRPSEGTWYVRGRAAVPYGVATDVLTPADFIGAGAAQIALWRPADNGWYSRHRSTVYWGLSGDIALS